MRVVTTVHKEGFEQYGHRWIDGIRNWPKAEFVLYAEGFDLIPAPHGVTVKRIEELPRLRELKSQYANYVAPNWEFDVVRFSNKVFAAYDAFYDYKGTCVWLDADCVTYRRLPRSFLKGMLPEACYMSLFKRAGYHSETGFWMQDGSHPEHKPFWDTWIAWFESGKFKTLRQWHDCTTLDATIRLFEKDGRIKTHNLSAPFHKEMHPMAKVELAKFLDHTKGGRKAKGFSPENKFREQA